LNSFKFSKNFSFYPVRSETLILFLTDADKNRTMANGQNANSQNIAKRGGVDDMKDVFYDDLRTLIEALDKAGNLKRVSGAHWDLEIGTISEALAMRGGAAALFENIPDYPGHRILTNVVQNQVGQRIAFGMDEEVSATMILKDYADKFAKFKPVPPKYVSTGPVMENVITGDDIDVLKFPTPKWHAEDGGRYIGTANCVITKDLEGDFINVATYRCQVQGKDTINVYSSPGKHATIMRDRYWASGKDFPVVVTFGQDPVLLGFSMMSLPWGMGEFEATGFFKGRPIEVIKGPTTGLPIPSTAEIAVECFMKKGEEMVEGRFGEWTGYYASEAKPYPIAKIKAIYHRNYPILQGQAPVPPPAYTWFPIPVHTVPTLWNNLVAAGLQGIKGVYIHGPGNRPICAISIQQRFQGHAKQVVMVTAGLLSGGGAVGKFIIVVDDDVDPANLEQVLAAVCMRCDIEQSVEIVRGFQNSPLDPSLSPKKRAAGEITQAKMLIDACKPWEWRDKFPRSAKASDQLIQEAMKKFPDLFR
jgi:4-hydroxy-3-polyprenylbenzoate decarboxylase